MKPYFLITVLASALLLLGAGCLERDDDRTTSGGASGNLYISVTDVAADMESVNEVTIVLDTVEVRDSAGNWHTIGSDQKTFNLLELKSESALKLLARQELEAGLYDSIRFSLDKVTVAHESEGKVDAQVPSKKVEIDVMMKVNENADSHVTLDFIADESLHEAEDGSFVFASVIEVESRSDAQVEVRTDDSVTVRGGTREETVTVGVDLTGATRINFRIDPKADISLDLFGNVETGTNTSTNGDTGLNADIKAQSDAKVDLGTEALY